MVIKRQIATRTEKTLRTEECSELVVAVIKRNITISISGTLKQKTILRSLVGMPANKLSVHSINKGVDKIPCEPSVGHHLLKVDWDLIQGVKSQILMYIKDQILVPENHTI